MRDPGSGVRDPWIDAGLDTSSAACSVRFMRSAAAVYGSMSPAAIRSTARSSSPAGSDTFDVLRRTGAPAARASDARAGPGAGPPALADRALNWPRATPQLRNSFAGRRNRLQNRRLPVVRPVRLQRQVRGDRLNETVGAVPIGLVDDEDVGNLHDSRLERLDLVAGARNEHERSRRRRSARSRSRPDRRRRSR